MSKKHNVLLIIDNREGNASKKNKNAVDLVKLWKAQSDYNYTIACYPLTVGDVWICESPEPFTVPTKYLLFGIPDQGDEGGVFPPEDPTVVVERKTVADLESSYSDGRYKEQKERLKACTTKSRVMYLMEGYDGRKITNATRKKRLLSTFTNTHFRDDINVYHTTSVQDSYEWINHACTQMANGKLDHTQKKRAKYTDNIKLSKKANLTADKGLEIMLAQVPGLSTAIGRAIGQEYATMTLLCKAFDEGGDELLTNLKVHDKRLGKKRSKRVYEYIS